MINTKVTGAFKTGKHPIYFFYSTHNILLPNNNYAKTTKQFIFYWHRTIKLLASTNFQNGQCHSHNRPVQY